MASGDGASSIWIYSERIKEVNIKIILKNISWLESLNFNINAQMENKLAAIWVRWWQWYEAAALSIELHDGNHERGWAGLEVASGHGASSIWIYSERIKQIVFVHTNKSYIYIFQWAGLGVTGNDSASATWFQINYIKNIYIYTNTYMCIFKAK